jgi:hypothetical protein
MAMRVWLPLTSNQKYSKPRWNGPNSYTVSLLPVAKHLFGRGCEARALREIHPLLLDT